MKKNIILIASIVMPLLSWAQSSIAVLDKANSILADVRAEYAPDARQNVYEIKAYNNPDGILVLSGAVSDSLAYQQIAKRLNAASIDFADSISILPYNDWAQVRLSVASLRTGGRHSAEMATQGLMGTPLRVLQRGGEWWRVQMPDGYIAWVPSSSVVSKTSQEMAQWRKSHRFVVTDPYQIRAYVAPDKKGLRDVVTDLVLGNIVEIPGDTPHVVNGMLEILLPDGRRGYVDKDKVQSIEEWVSQPFDAQRILDIAYSMEGTPYLWGGTSTKSLDCSGLAKTSYFANGIILMRDASQQALTGQRIEAKNWRQCKAGDLLFFGNASTGKVTHVAIYDHDGNYVHSSGRVKRNSVDPESEAYLTTPFLHAVRIDGFQETPGITRARNHPWYF